MKTLEDRIAEANKRFDALDITKRMMGWVNLIRPFIANEIRQAVLDERKEIAERFKSILINNSFGHDDEKLGTIIAVDYGLAMMDIDTLLIELEK